MLSNNKLAVDREDQQQTAETDIARAYRVKDDKAIEESDLKKVYVFGVGGDGSNAKPVREGQPMGGHAFGKNNNTPAGDDKNNPSQNAGYSNAYFARTEPAEEHPEDSNFTAKYQDGAPDYDKAQPHPAVKNESPKPDPIERGNGVNDRPHTKETYKEGTADNDETNTPGPNEVPDQQKVGEEMDDPREREHIET